MIPVPAGAEKSSRSATALKTVIPAKAGSYLLLTAVLHTLAFCEIGAPWLAGFAWVAFLPFFLRLKTVTSARQAFVFGYLTGVAVFVPLLYWLWHVTVFGWLLLSLGMALYVALFAVIAFWLSRRSALVAVPAAWVVVEWLRANLFSGFGWALLGYSQYRFLPLIQISEFTGVYGVSFLVMAVNCVLAELIFELSRGQVRGLTLTQALGAVLLVVTSLGYGAARLAVAAPAEASSELKVAVIQGNIPQERKWQPEFADDIFWVHQELTKQSLEQGAELIVWPETSAPGYVNIEPILEETLAELAGQGKSALLVGAPSLDLETGFFPEYFNSAVLLTEQGIEERYDKLHLVPYGEYIPGERWMPVLRQLIVTGDFSPGKTPHVFTLYPQPHHNPQRVEPARFAVMICFEDVFAPQVRSFVRAGAQFLINITNDAWFGRSAAPFQHLAASVFRAVEFGRSVVRSANTGVSGFVDSYGRIYSPVSGSNGRWTWVEG
ncbi:MAG: apolipoprotein N-acyltransferase, partial [Candidatus Omnitrophica bacterium]|nr:apolipoprotein N-acyltransferase [Candidatus Omnitrophota bacterium]